MANVIVSEAERSVPCFRLHSPPVKESLEFRAYCLAFESKSSYVGSYGDVDVQQEESFWK
ncbi:hypothetical protein YC2023_069828 [Brassica napus]